MIRSPAEGVHTGIGIFLFSRYKDKITPIAAVLKMLRYKFNVRRLLFILTHLAYRVNAKQV